LGFYWAFIRRGGAKKPVCPNTRAERSTKRGENERTSAAWVSIAKGRTLKEKKVRGRRALAGREMTGRDEKDGGSVTNWTEKDEKEGIKKGLGDKKLVRFTKSDSKGEKKKGDMTSCGEKTVGKRQKMRSPSVFITEGVRWVPVERKRTIAKRKNVKIFQGNRQQEGGGLVRGGDASHWGPAAVFL